MTDPCKKCGNTILPERHEISPGLTARPCPLCGDQGYDFPPSMMQPKDGAEVDVKICTTCGTEYYLPYKAPLRKHCDDCLSIVRSRISVQRNRKRREAGEFIGIRF